MDNRKFWMKDEEQLALQMFKERKTILQGSEAVGRTYNSCRAKKDYFIMKGLLDGYKPKGSAENHTAKEITDENFPK